MMDKPFVVGAINFGPRGPSLPPRPVAEAAMTLDGKPCAAFLPLPAQSPPPPLDPHVAALLAIADALREVAAALRTGRDTTRDDLK